MPIKDIRPGMKGYAVTVFSGTKSDRFEIEVIDVVRDYLPRQDTVLFRSNDPRLMHTGIVGGMSGSPIYIEGKLAGALAYGYSYNKDPIGGISPIENMLAVDALPFRPKVLPHGKNTGTSRGTTRAGTRGWADAMLGLNVSPLPPRRRPGDLNPSAGLQRLDTPMAVSGFGPTATRMLSEQLGMVATRGGGGSGGGGGTRDMSGPKKQWKPGDSLSVLLTRGDNATAVNGTVTWVGGKQGERLLAFGHPMFDEGPSEVPIADARVHVIIPSVRRSNKIASPLTLQGTMVQDRQAAIGVRTDLTPTMIPVITHMKPAEADIPPRTYRSEVAKAVDLTPRLVSALLVDAAEEAGTDAVDLTATIKQKIALTTSKGPRELVVSEETFFPMGATPRSIGQARGVFVMAALLDNQFEVAEIRSVEQWISMEYGDPVEEIARVRVAQGDVHAGDLVRLAIDFRTLKGVERREFLELRIPDDAADEDVLIEITGGDYVRPYRPMPNNLDDLIDTLEQSYPSRSMVATIYREQEGLSSRDGLLTDLPGSVLHTLQPRGDTRAAVPFKQMARRVIPTKTLIEGSHKLKVSVLPKRAHP